MGQYPLTHDPYEPSAALGDPFDPWFMTHCQLCYHLLHFLLYRIPNHSGTKNFGKCEYFVLLQNLWDDVGTRPRHARSNYVTRMILWWFPHITIHWARNIYTTVIGSWDDVTASVPPSVLVNVPRTAVYDDDEHTWYHRSICVWSQHCIVFGCFISCWT
jgi:hypothetical protein